jgi:tetratricopeptide (TPR) repeat protein
MNKNPRGSATPSKMPKNPTEMPNVAVGVPIDLVVLACKWQALLCRPLGTATEVTYKTTREGIPGSIMIVVPARVWANARRLCLAGNLLGTRYEVASLGIEPLALNRVGEWDPCEEYWAEDGEPIADWAKPLIVAGKRPLFKMEQVIPGWTPADDIDSDPIIEASGLGAAGDHDAAEKILMNLLARDLRCLDAHAHLGNLRFDYRPEVALRHYEVGVSIGLLSLGAGFDGVLAWGLIDNRPFLRCLNGAGLCSWRVGDRAAASAVFRRLLELNPTDNQGARLNLAAIEVGKSWEDAHPVT